MDTETQKILSEKPNNKIEKEFQEEEKEKIFERVIIFKKYLFVIVPLLFFFTLIYLLIGNKTLNNEISGNNNNNTYSNMNTKQTLNIFEEFHSNLFDDTVLLKYKQKQNEFCYYIEHFLREEYENNLLLTNVSLLSQFFPMYVYKNNDIISTEIIQSENWEGDDTNNLLSALLFYTIINRLKREDVFVLDIGSNIGWYSLFIGKYGYSILAFEPSELNHYILMKNYCLNQELNVTFIKKGLYSEEKNCDFYINEENVGDGWVFCDNINNNKLNNLKKTGEVLLTKLSNYESFLMNHNLAMIRIDAQGMDGKAIEGGIRLINKYRVPFIFLKFRPESLILHGTDPRHFLKLFLKNGYKIGRYNFFIEDYLSIEEVMKKAKGSMNLYLVHSRLIKKYKYFQFS